MSDELKTLRSLSRALGVHTRYIDGLRKPVTVAPETLVRVCAALGAPIERPADAAKALRAHRASVSTGALPPVMVAWDGVLVPPLPIRERGSGGEAYVQLEDGTSAPLDRPLPLGYHRLTVESSGREETCTVISAPVMAYRRPGSHRSWGVGTQLAALRSARSRSLGDLRDLESLCGWVRERGGDLVTALPLLPTFNSAPPPPSPARTRR